MEKKRKFSLKKSLVDFLESSATMAASNNRMHTVPPERRKKQKNVISLEDADRGFFY